MKIKRTFQKVLLGVLSLCLCFLAGVGIGIYLDERDNGNVAVSVEYFRHTKADCMDFNVLVAEYLDGRDEELVECYAVPRRNGVALVVLDKRDFLVPHGEIKKELGSFYTGYMSAANNSIPIRTTMEIEYTEYIP